MTVQTAYLIEKDLKRAFKSLCARRGVTMSDRINAFIRSEVSSDPLGENFWKGDPIRYRDASPNRWEESY